MQIKTIEKHFQGDYFSMIKGKFVEDNDFLLDCICDFIIAPSGSIKQCTGPNCKYRNVSNKPIV